MGVYTLRIPAGQTGDHKQWFGRMKMMEVEISQLGHDLRQISCCAGMRQIQGDHWTAEETRAFPVEAALLSEQDRRLDARIMHLLFHQLENCAFGPSNLSMPKNVKDGNAIRG